MPVGGPQRTASGVAALACRRACPRVTAYAAATFADRAYAARFDPCAFPASADLLAGLPHMPMGVRRTRLMQRARKGVQACLQMGDAPCGRSFGASRRLAWYVILGG